jgi:hypothetical protein
LKPETINLRWRLPKPDIPVYQLLFKIAKKFQLLSACFGVRTLNGAIGKAPSRNRKCEIQDGGCQTGSTCVSASIQDSKKISEANPMFSGSGNSMVLLIMLYLETGSEKFKMAAAKLELHISQLRYKIAKKFIVFSGSGDSMTPWKGSMSKRKWHIWLLNFVFLFLNCMHSELVDKLPPSWISDFRFRDVALQKAPLSSPIQKYADSLWTFYNVLYRSWNTGTSRSVPPIEFLTSGFEMASSRQRHWLVRPRKHGVAIGISFLSDLDLEMRWGVI